MKIALICTEKLPVPPIAGGAIQLYIEGIVPYLSKQHDITVYSIEYPGLPSEETRGNVKYVRVPAASTSKYISNIKLKLTPDFDLVHIFNRPLWVLTLSERFPDMKFSLSLHNEMFHPEKVTEDQGVKIIKRVEFINTVSKFIADGVNNRFPIAENKLNVVYSGADIDNYKQAGSPEAKINKEHLKEKYRIRNYKVVLFIGRLGPKKGAHILMKAMRQVMDTHQNVALVIVGSKWYGKNEEDDYSKQLQKLAHNLKGPIVFTGFLPPSEIPQHFNMGDIFVCVSQWNEPLARVHYEAMAAGLPIITTNRGGNAEIVAGYGNGIVIDDYSNPDAFAKCIDSLLSSPEAAEEMGRNGRKLAETRYNWERVSKELSLLLSDTKPAPLPVNSLGNEADIPGRVCSESDDVSKNKEVQMKSDSNFTFELDF